MNNNGTMKRCVAKLIIILFIFSIIILPYPDGEDDGIDKLSYGDIKVYFISDHLR